MRNTPPTYDTIFKYFESFVMYFVDDEKAAAIAIKGTASPAENIESNIAP